MEEKQKGSTRNIACKIRLNDEENNILDKICKETDSTKSDVMRSALAAYYKEMMLNPAQKQVIFWIMQKSRATSTALNSLFLSIICLSPKTDT